MDVSNMKYRLYGLVANMFVMVGVLLVSKDVSVKGSMDIGFIVVLFSFIGILYFLYKKLGAKVAQMAARFILDIYPKYMMKYENKNKMTKKVQKDLEILSSTDSLFVLIRYNLYVVSSVLFLIL